MNGNKKLINLAETDIFATKESPSYLAAYIF